jgi:threonine dehydratase
MEPAASRPTPDHATVAAAHQRIRDHVRRTPVRSAASLDAVLGCRLLCKCENLQEIGAFKIRGAVNAVLRLREAGITADVATHSSGNHGAALAAAARLDGRRAVIVMPQNSVAAKIENVRRFGAEVRLCPPGQQARERGLQELVDAGLVPVHPYDDPDIISGQGTAALELLEEEPNIDVLITPVGGGGLLAGCAIAARHLRPGIRVVGAEPAGAADTAESLRRGERVTEWHPDTLADGLRALVGELTFPIIRDQVNEVLTVSERGIIDGMELVWRHLGMLIEPSSATVIAAIREHPEPFAGCQVGAILTGGNVEPDLAAKLTGAPGG